MFDRASRWLPLAFLLSLAANLFFGGVMLADGRHPPRTGGDPVLLLDRVAAKLPPVDAAIVRKSIDGRGQILAAERDRRKEFKRRVRELLQSDSFDKTALSRLLDDNEKAEADFRRRMREGFAEAAAAVSPEARRLISQFETEGAGHDR